MLLLMSILAADLSGTWVGSVHGGPMCLALSQSGQEVAGNLAYENDRKYAAIANGKVMGDGLSFEVADLDRGTMAFRFRVGEEKLLGDDGAVLTKWVPRGNRQFNAGRPSAPTLISRVDPNYSEQARKEHVTGTVKLAILVLTNGDVDRKSIKVLSSVGYGLDDAAIEAVRQRKFGPPREDCNFYEKRIPVEIAFR
jgi:TonB family protein